MTEEKLADRIKRIRKELATAELQMQNCSHNFSDPVRATRERQEAVFDHYEPHGSDPEPIYKYYPKTEHGWERTCQTCGKTEYTTDTKPTKYGPDFGGKRR